MKTTYNQSLQVKFRKAEQNCFGAPAETFLKIEDLRFNETTG